MHSSYNKNILLNRMFFKIKFKITGLSFCVKYFIRGRDSNPRPLWGVPVVETSVPPP